MEPTLEQVQLRFRALLALEELLQAHDTEFPPQVAEELWSIYLYGRQAAFEELWELHSL